MRGCGDGEREREGGREMEAERDEAFGFLGGRTAAAGGGGGGAADVRGVQSQETERNGKDSVCRVA